MGDYEMTLGGLPADTTAVYAAIEKRLALLIAEGGVSGAVQILSDYARTQRGLGDRQYWDAVRGVLDRAVAELARVGG